MPAPTDKAAVQRFLGMCQYLSKFCQSLSETVLPLRNFTKDDSVFLWSESHETQFNSATSLFASTTVLCYHDPHIPVTLQVNASDYAIGRVLLNLRSGPILAALIHSVLRRHGIIGPDTESLTLVLFAATPIGC